MDLIEECTYAPAGIVGSSKVGLAGSLERVRQVEQQHVISTKPCAQTRCLMSVSTLVRISVEPCRKNVAVRL